QYAESFTEAVRAGFAKLTPDQRLVLRLHALDGLTGDQIAATLQIHRATVVRWIARAREDIVREATKVLRERLRISPSELERVATLLGSRIELSVSQLLA